MSPAISHYVRRASVLASTIGLFGALFVAWPAAAAAPIPCAGNVQITGVTNQQVWQAGPNTFVSFGFTALHDLCLADGSVVVAAVEGTLWQRIGGDGSMNLRFDEVATYGGGTLAYRGEASLNESGWHASVRTVGNGTGVLSGIHGQGTFWPTSPSSFGDVISYVYR